MMLRFIHFLLVCLPISQASAERWWAFQPLNQASPPELPGLESPVDQFVLSRLRENDMTFAPKASRETLLRRLYVTLVGMPPTLEEADAFLSANPEGAWERQIDALLEDPRYGEHWATMWLDLVRYSDSDGWNQDAFRPHIWRYRDYVVNAFNDDKPYPEFVREQLAGDELEGDNPEHLEAAGYLRLGIYEYNQRDVRNLWSDVLNEITDTTGDVFLGMSLACARCHDHKFDDITQKDYFKLRAFFEPIIWRDDLTASTNQEKERYAAQLEKWKAATESIREDIAKLLKPYHDRKWKSTVGKFPFDIQACFHKPVSERDSLEHQMAYLVARQFEEEGGGPLKNMKQEDEVTYESLKKSLAAYDHLKPKPLPPVMTAAAFDGPHSPTVIPDHEETVLPGFLSAMEDDSSVGFKKKRLALANWIADPNNPLTTRVLVNRVWQQHFGEGLVSTASDFGRKGQRASHPKLLDWLAREFVGSGWSIKHLHRVILQSWAWQQSTQHPEAAAYQKRDPEEKMLWRSRVRRLSAEGVRDSMLLLSGELVNKVGGPGVDEDVPRRALYVKRFRNDNDTFLHAFDMTPGLKSTPQRNETTTPMQALTMINGDYVMQRAKAWSKRLQDEDGYSWSQVHDVIRSAWGRKPLPDEINHAMSFLEASQGTWTDFCHVMLNSNEFLYVH